MYYKPDSQKKTRLPNNLQESIVKGEMPNKFYPIPTDY